MVMNLLDGEKEIEKHEIGEKDKLILTNKRLIHEEGSSHNLNIQEFPLNKLDSIVYGKEKPIWAIVLGALLFFIGIILNVFFRYTIYNPIIWSIYLIGIIFIICGIFCGGEDIEFRSITTPIKANSKGLKAFADKVRNEAFG